MNKKEKEKAIKLFGISNQLAELELDKIEDKYSINLGRSRGKIEKDNIYYPQFDLEIRNEAKQMAKSYEIFYCLERSIRDLISTSMETAHGDSWWDTKVSTFVKDETKKRIKAEIDSGVTPRSADPIDFTTFGELGEIIKTNWDVFGSIFNSPIAVGKVMATLNTVRAPIAHSTKLAEDEELRLQLGVRDWFKLME